MSDPEKSYGCDRIRIRHSCSIYNIFAGSWARVQGPRVHLQKWMAEALLGSRPGPLQVPLVNPFRPGPLQGPLVNPFRPGPLLVPLVNPFRSGPYSYRMLTLSGQDPYRYRMLTLSGQDPYRNWMLTLSGQTSKCFPIS